MNQPNEYRYHDTLIRCPICGHTEISAATAMTAEMEIAAGEITRQNERESCHE